MPCGGPSGGHQWRFGRLFPEWPCSAHGRNLDMFVIFTSDELLLNVGRVLNLNRYSLFSVLRLTLRKMWIWRADQVSCRLSMFDFVLAVPVMYL